MKLAVSNIGWDASRDEEMYIRMEDIGFRGIEIAPTRIIPVEPYESIDQAKDWAEGIKHRYGFVVPSMQSIWYGKQEKLFGSEYERVALMDYTKAAVRFAEGIGCGNLVFGCPRNRSIPENADYGIAIDFFRTIGDYAAAHNTVIAMEANPPIYNTNFINDTAAAIELIEEVDSNGFKLNLDIGTMIEISEEASILEGKVHLINHVHVSEPGLKPVRKRDLHADLSDLLRDSRYENFVSIEMARREDTDSLIDTMRYVKEVFG